MSNVPGKFRYSGTGGFTDGRNRFFAPGGVLGTPDPAIPNMRLDDAGFSQAASGSSSPVATISNIRGVVLSSVQNAVATLARLPTKALRAQPRGRIQFGTATLGATTYFMNNSGTAIDWLVADGLSNIVKSGGGATISWSGSVTTNTGSSLTISWTGGSPTSSGSTTNYVYADYGTSPNGITITVPVGTAAQQITIVGTVYSSTSANACRVSASLSDDPGEIVDTTITVAGGSQATRFSIPVTVQALSASQTLTITLKVTVGESAAGVIFRAIEYRTSLITLGAGTPASLVNSTNKLLLSVGSSEEILLLNFEGADAATATSDESTRLRGAATFVGNAQLDTAQFKYGSSSLLMDGTGDYITFPDSDDFDLGSDNFTLEAFVRFNSVSGFQTIICKHKETTLRSWSFDWTGSSNNLLRLLTSTNGSATTAFQFAWVPVINTWYHVCAERSGTDVRLYVDGAMIGKSAGGLSGSLFNNTEVIRIGAIGGSPDANFFNGWIDGMRITRGLALYASDSGFTPPESMTYPRGNTRTSLLRSAGKAISSSQSAVASVVRSAAKFLTSLQAAVANLVPNFTGGSGGTEYPQAADATTAPASSVVKNTAHFVSALGAQAASLLRSTTHTMQAATSDVASLVRSAGKFIQATTSDLGSLVRSTGKRAQATTLDVATLVRATGKVITNNVSTVVSLLRAMAHGVQATTSDVATLVRSAAKRLQATTSDVATLSTIKVFLTSLQATTSDIATLVRSTAKPLSALGAQVSSLVRSAAKRLQATTADVASLTAIKVFLRSITVDASAVASLSTLIQRLVSLQATTAPVASLQRAMAHAISVTATQASSLLRATAKRLQATTSDVASLSALKVFLRSIQATTSDLASLIRSTLHGSQASSSPVASLRRAIAHAISATAAQVASLVRSTGKTLRATVNTVASLTAVKVFLRSVQASASATASLVRSTGKAISATAAQVTSLLRAIASRFSATADSEVSTTITTGKPLSGASGAEGSILHDISKTIRATASAVATGVGTRLQGVVASVAATVIASIASVVTRFIGTTTRIVTVSAEVREISVGAEDRMVSLSSEPREIRVSVADRIVEL